jgi:hypothetical protein
MKGRESGGVKEFVSEWICEFVTGNVRVNKTAKIHYRMNKCVFE